jgi:RNA recognition motif-containing protein
MKLFIDLFHRENVKSLFVKNVAANVTEEQLKALFGESCERVVIPLDRKRKVPLGLFSSSSSAFFFFFFLNYFFRSITHHHIHKHKDRDKCSLFKYLTELWCRHAFAHFTTREEAQAAMIRLNGTELAGRKLAIEWCLPMEAKPKKKRKSPPTFSPPYPPSYAPPPPPPYTSFSLSLSLFLFSFILFTTITNVVIHFHCILDT